MSGNPFGYPQPVWRLFNEAPGAGALEGAGVIVAEAGTPASTSRLRLQVKMAGARIDQARFQAYGCPTTIAVGAWLAGRVVGSTVEDLPGIDSKLIREALEIADDRTHCALLGEDVVKSLLSHIGPASCQAAAR